MGPELLDPETFGLTNSEPTKKSDCYALGMVMFEVLSGHAPFPGCKGAVVIDKVMGGEHPRRLRGARGLWFTDDIWEMIKRCWSHQPDHRPGVEAMLECLERVSAAWHPPSPMVGDGVQVDSDDESCSTVTCLCMFSHSVTNPRLTFEVKAIRFSAPPSPRLLATPPTVGSLAQGSSDIITAESTDASEASLLSQPLEKLDPEESVRTVDQVSWTRLLDEIWYELAVPLGFT